MPSELEKILDGLETEVGNILAGIARIRTRCKAVATTPTLTGDQARMIREYLDLTQQELADTIGVSDNTAISRWESNPTHPPSRLQSAKIIAQLRAKLIEEGRSGDEPIDEIMRFLATARIKR